MERLWAEVPDGMKKRLIDLALEKGYEKPNGLIVEALERMLDGTPPSTETAPAPPTLDAATSVFLAHIDPDQRNLLLSLCQETNAHPSDYLLSYVKLAHERGETSMLLSEQGRAGFTPDPVAYAAIGQGMTPTCQFCHQPFQATRPGQIYCPTAPEGEESCSRKAALAELRGKRDARLTTKKDDKDVLAPKQVPQTVLRHLAQVSG